MRGIFDVVCPDCAQHRTLTSTPRGQRCQPYSAKARATPILDRLDAASIPTESGCWEWALYRDPGGYGRINYGGVTGAMAYRVSYEALVGPIPNGLQIDHLCRNHACVNPAHLEPVTAQENQRRGYGPSGINHRKTECIRGHTFTPENTMLNHRGHRRCVTCARAREAVAKRTRAANPKYRPAFTRIPVPDRFRSKCELSGSGCIRWAGSVSSTGCGTFNTGDGTVLAHRYAYALAYGEIPLGLDVVQSCGDLLCLSLAHLKLAPRSQRNMRTHCKAGHEMTGDNVYLRPDTGGRQCKSCSRSRIRTKVAA